MLIAIDFEYRQISEQKLQVVCVAYMLPHDKKPQTLWLLDHEENTRWFTVTLNRLNAEGHTFLCYNAIAEAGAFYSLGLDPTKFKWIDLMLEYKQLRNGNYSRLYGDYLDKKGRPKKSYAPPVDEYGKTIKKNQLAKQFHKDNSQTPTNLTSCVYAVLGEIISSEHKDLMRNIIIHGGSELLARKQEVLDYCGSDVIYLHKLFNQMSAEIMLLSGQKPAEYKASSLARGEWAARLAVMERTGIPVNRQRLLNIGKNYEEITNTAIVELNHIYPFYVQEKRKGEMIWVQKYSQVEGLIRSLGLEETWPKTNTDKFSTNKETLEANDHIKEIRAFRRTREMINQIKAFREGGEWEDVDSEDDTPSTEGKENIFQRVGTDSRLRCYFNPYGTQTSRNAPPARSFLLAMSSWIRAAMEAPEGYTLLSADYSSEEFLIAAILSNDRVMAEAYYSGDPYLAFAKAAGMVPASATKKSHPEQRTLCKSLILGLQYSMGIAKLHQKIIKETQNPNHTEDDTRALYRLHKETFYRYWEWNENQIDAYSRRVPMKTMDGWYLFCDNPNPRSAGNFPVQAMGGAILREAVKLAQDAGIEVIAPLHDALYCLAPTEKAEETKVKLISLMQQAFTTCCGGKIRVDCGLYPHGKLYIEDKGAEHFRKLCQYMLTPEDYMNAIMLGVAE